MIKASKRAAAVAAGLTLSACGGGGGGSAVVTIPPPPQTADAFPLTQSASFETIAASRSYTVPTGGNRTVDQFGVAGRNSGLAISYDAAAGSYTVSDANGSASFDPTQRSTSGGFDTYASATGADQLRLFGNVRSGGSPAGAPISLTYLSFGNWSHDDSSGEHRDSYFLFGYPTASSDMPKSGSASYSTFVSANAVSMIPGEGETALGGSATFTANFATGTVDTALTLPLTNFGSPSSTYNGDGTIAGNQFSGAFKTSDDPTFNSGTFAGGFFGPGAKEMGYTFAISRGSADPFGGAALQPPLTWVVGAVVGSKQ